MVKQLVLMFGALTLIIALLSLLTYGMGLPSKIIVISSMIVLGICNTNKTENKE